MAFCMRARRHFSTGLSTYSRCGHAIMANSIEVERKFEPPSDIALLGQMVQKHGGELIGTKAFTDVYFDTPDLSLTRRDTWLRSRDGSWEIKLPVEENAIRSGGERTIFQEVEGPIEVNSVLQSVLGVDGRTLEDTFRNADIQPFAEFTTTRSKWTLGACTIDADVASFGHAVMEIEVLVEKVDEVTAAEAEIAKVASLVGAKPLGALGGKLETYIRRFAPDVCAALIEEGIFETSHR